MESMNKFKVLTVVIICLFIFTVAAIYTNTKEESAKSSKAQKQKTTVQKVVKDVEYADKEFGKVVNDVLMLNKRVDELSDRLNERDTSSEVVTCRILGTLANDGVEELSPDAAVQDAKINNNPLVITCRL